MAWHRKALRHNLNQCLLIVDWNLKMNWKSHENKQHSHFFHEHAYEMSLCELTRVALMMTPSNGTIFRFTGPLWGEPNIKRNYIREWSGGRSAFGFFVIRRCCFMLYIYSWCKWSTFSTWLFPYYIFNITLSFSSTSIFFYSLFSFTRKDTFTKQRNTIHPQITF